MDMTNMIIENRSFDVVYDKGSLDALMGEDSLESIRMGIDFLEEVFD